jgi:glycosyltransferase involved in cell wall biosynthesis
MFADKPQTATVDRFVRVLFAGTMGKLKGERDLIAALRRVPDLTSRVRLVMLGRGAETIEPLCRESGLWPVIDHFGAVPLDERVTFFKWADLFVLPTYAEGMPMVVLEAMAAGLPIISTPVGGIPELIENGVEGFLVEPGDVNALADRITRLVEDRTERQQMGARGQAKAREFDLSLVLERLGAELRAATDRVSAHPASVKHSNSMVVASPALMRVKRTVKE